LLEGRVVRLGDPIVDPSPTEALATFMLGQRDDRWSTAYWFSHQAGYQHGGRTVGAAPAVRPVCHRVRW
jgi:hypothetical protein